METSKYATGFVAVFRDVMEGKYNLEDSMRWRGVKARDADSLSKLVTDIIGRISPVDAKM